MADAGSRTYGQWWSSNQPIVRVSIADVERIGRAAYESVGASADDAAFILDMNLDKALQGDHARGLSKVPGLVRFAREGRLDLAPTLRIVREKGATALVDGGPKAAGRLVCRHAMAVAIDKARTHGVGVVGARASGDILTPFVRMAVDAGMVGMALVQSVPTVAPLGGFVPLLGNAPIAFGVPARDRDPVILDMSFTNTSASGVLQAAEQGQTLPPGYLLDRHGEPTTDPGDFPDWELTQRLGGTSLAVHGSLVPLGGGHKGYAMVFVVGLLASLLTATSPPWELYHHLPERGTYGTVLMAVDPAAFDPGDVLGKVDGFIDRVTGEPRRDDADEILYPGAASQRLKRERRASGFVPVPRADYESFVALAAELGEDPPRVAPDDDAPSTGGAP